MLNAGYSIADYVQGENNFNHWSAAASSVTFLLCAALATPRNRGRIHRHLGRLGGRGTEAEEAAAVAALVGGSDPDAALERASKLLRCLPASRLHAAVFYSRRKVAKVARHGSPDSSGGEQNDTSDRSRLSNQHHTSEHACGDAT